MTSLRQRDNGIWEIQYINEHGRKKTITLSGKKYSSRTAMQLQEAVTVLVDKKINNDPTIHRPTQAWVESASLEIRTKLAQRGLWRLPSTHTTGELWDTFFEKHPEMHEETMKTYVYSKNRFFAFFKPGELLDELTQDRMKKWKEFLGTEYKSPRTKRPLDGPTIAGTISKAKAVFNWAKEKDWIDKSPLDGVGRGSFRNEENDREITMEEYYRLINAATCLEWRVIIALARIGGLRAPSEIMRVRWSKIDWENRRFTFLGSKKGKDGKKKERTVPLFDELRCELEALYERDRDKGNEFVINRYPSREKACWGTQFARIAERARLGEIDRPFDNMRASRSNEIYAIYGPAVESEWIGHSMKTAERHYLGVQEWHFDHATGRKTTVSMNLASAETKPEIAISQEQVAISQEQPVLLPFFTDRFPVNSCFTAKITDALNRIGRK